MQQRLLITCLLAICLFTSSGLLAGGRAGDGQRPLELVRVLIQTEKGDIEVELDRAKAPVTVDNFLRYMDGKFYDGGRFHRTVKPGNQPDNTVKIEVIQAGGKPEKAKEEFAPIKLERTRDTKLGHKDGTISMARDGPDTATSDFFICIGDQPELDFGGKRNPDGQGFAAFGQVVKGMHVVRTIQAAPAQGQTLTPSVKILTMTRRSGGFAHERRDNWHHWRGPEACGWAPHADPPITWDAQKNVKWKVPVPGRGSATPIVWGDQVFVVTAVKTDRIAAAADLPRVDPVLERKTTPPANYHQFVVMSFDRETGKLRWKKQAAEKVPHEGHHPTHSYAAGSPTTDGRRLYVSFGSFGIYCYDLDGKIRWQRDLGRLVTRYGWGEAVTPVVHGDCLVLNWDQEQGAALICLDAATGETKWKADRDEKTSWNTPLVVEHQGRTQVIVNGKNRIRSHDLATGKVLWETGGMTINPIPSPVAADGVVYCMSGYTGSSAVAVALDAQGDAEQGGKVLWRYGKGTPYCPSPLLLGDRLYFTAANSAFLTILDRKTGMAVLKQERLTEQESFYASPVAAKDRIYLVDRDGTTVVLKAGDTLEVLATNTLGDRVDASPALVGRQLFLRGENYVWCMEAAR
jgi:cyclophilin family peptidyl-prolyl cis-trans isomerase/outer membrane protein assembly factor BamB